MRTTVVQLDIDGARACSAYLALPTRVPAPGLVLLQEIFGVNPSMRALAQRYAQAGYVVIVPDLFWRQEPGLQLDPAVPEQRDQAMRLFKGLDEGRAVQDAAFALGFVRRHAACTGRVGAVGYCLGGKLAYLMAARTDVDASVSYYGVGITSALSEASAINKPLMLHIAGRDHLCPPQAQQAIIAALTPLHERATIHVYEEAGHAFARPGGGEYSEPVARTADERTLSFLARHLNKSE